MDLKKGPQKLREPVVAPRRAIAFMARRHETVFPNGLSEGSGTSREVETVRVMLIHDTYEFEPG